MGSSVAMERVCRCDAMILCWVRRRVWSSSANDIELMEATRMYGKLTSGVIPPELCKPTRNIAHFAEETCECRMDLGALVLFSCIWWRKFRRLEGESISGGSGEDTKKVSIYWTWRDCAKKLALPENGCSDWLGVPGSARACK